MGDLEATHAALGALAQTVRDVQARAALSGDAVVAAVGAASGQIRHPRLRAALDVYASAARSSHLRVDASLGGLSGFAEVSSSSYAGADEGLAREAG